MEIPIFNTIYHNTNKSIKSNDLNFKKLNNLDLKEVDTIKFPSVNILKLVPNKISLFETVIVSANDELVNLFLKKQIKFTDISKMLLKILKAKKFTKYKRLKPKKIDDIIQLNRYVRSVINYY